MAEILVRDNAGGDERWPGHAAAVRQLVDDLSGEHTVALDVRPPPARGINHGAWETVTIFIAGGVANALMPRVVDDLYAALKAWAGQHRRDRRDGKKQADDPVSAPEYSWTILGPDGRPLKSSWDRDRDTPQ